MGGLFPTTDAWIGDIRLHPETSQSNLTSGRRNSGPFPKNVNFHPWNSKVDMPPPSSLSVDQIPRLPEPWSGKR